MRRRLAILRRMCHLFHRGHRHRHPQGHPSRHPALHPPHSACGDPVVWVIGASAYSHLAGLDGFNCQGFIYQPNARNVDKDYNWDRLLADIPPSQTTLMR